MYNSLTDWDAETERRVQMATDNFRAGYNCSQSVAMAFADLYGIPLPLMAHLSASYGGGIGRMRETCGSALGIFMLAGLEVTNVEDTPEVGSSDKLQSFGQPSQLSNCKSSNCKICYPNQALKKKNYEVVQRLAADFRTQTGSIICKELLGLNKQRADGTIPEIHIQATPDPRTDEYYRKRPCIRMVETATRVYMNYLKEKHTAPQTTSLTI
jgi:hypothetical protein